jgi:NADH-quinone oxidoreductase subunit L
MSNLPLIILILPLLGFLVNSLWNSKIKGKTAGVIASSAVFISFISTLALFFTQINPLTINLFDWFKVGQMHLSFDLLIDSLSLVMMLVVTGVGFLIHVYSIGYMAHDENETTFFAYMNLFMFAMLLLVMSANYVGLFIGWEGVGLCSYLLIGFWFKNNDYNYAARKAFIMNRIGDLGFLAGMILLFYTFGSLSFSEIFTKAAGLPVGASVITLITILLLIGALGKSAQIPLYTWLPDAMAGPTPVSALIHAATMVTAGIYMIVRSNVLFSLAPFTQEIIVIVGISTAIFAAIIGLMQTDIKKVLAYSTVSQLGYMFLALGLGAYSSAIFHVTTHAFFKALLFLAAGSVIHALGGEQDIRKMGGLRSKIKSTYYIFLIGTIAISGIFPFSGFFSKDEILFKAFQQNPLLWGLGMFGAVLTSFYMFRLLYLTFFGQFRGSVEKSSHLHESPAVMLVPIGILAILAIIGGFLNLPELFGGHLSFQKYLNILSPAHEGSHSVEITLIIVSQLVLAIVIFAAWIRYSKKGVIPSEEKIATNTLNRLIYAKFYIDEIYQFLFVKPVEYLSGLFYKTIELKMIDNLVNQSGNLIDWLGTHARKLQSGNISFYIFGTVISIILLFIYTILF